MLAGHSRNYAHPHFAVRFTSGLTHPYNSYGLLQFVCDSGCNPQGACAAVSIVAINLLLTVYMISTYMYATNKGIAEKKAQQGCLRST